jgi:hypothetical protein
MWIDVDKAIRKCALAVFSLDSTHWFFPVCGVPDHVGVG